ncbi:MULTISPECIES: hypothetical protein [unclassified Microbulbifer]|uniref:hypothetical protein n=1 Tax=unclassified Microbulbifer TaxID=2619833 RepID=UPI0027E52610|nr:MULTISPECIES: hypothetical protein [unclassified Microbulbifer]
MQDLTLAESLTGLFGMFLMLFVLAIISGALLKLLLFMVPVLAFPTYIGLIYLEYGFSFFKNNRNKRILSVRFPKTDPYKRIMNASAAFITFNFLPYIQFLIDKLSSPNGHVELLKEMTRGEVIHPVLMFLIFVALLAIYLVSYFFGEEKDSSPTSKLERLAIPQLWKVVAAKTG